MTLLAAGPDGRSRCVKRRGRKVRTPQSSVPDNVREAGFKPGRRKVPQKTYRLVVAVSLVGKGETQSDGEVRVKRCGKSAPPLQQWSGQGKPHTEQDQIGRKLGFGRARAGSVRQTSG